MKKKEKIKYIKPQMRFNTGLHKFEPVLPLRKSSKKEKINIGWTWWIAIAIAILIGVGVLILAKKYGAI